MSRSLLSLPMPGASRAAAFSSAGALAALALLFPLTARAELTLDDLRETEAQIQELSARVLPATVSLIPGGNARRFGTGSGVVVSRDGLILTAAHVAMEMNEKVTVIFPNGDRAEADVLGMDFSRDAAMLQIVGKGDYKYVELGDSDAMETNEWCVALGHAGGYQADRTPPVRLGRVVNNDPEQFLTSDSALIGGDSGGPLFDIDGKLIGIHSNIGFSLAQNRHVPISVFVANWERLKKGERYGGDHVGGLLLNPERPVIGAMLEDVKNKAGAFIRSVMPGSPAQKAGLDSGDTVIQVDQTEVKNVATLMAELETRKVGDTLRLTVRNGKVERGVAVKLVAAGKLQHGLENGAIPDAGPRERRKRPAKPKAKPDAETPEKPKEAESDKTKPGKDGDKASTPPQKSKPKPETDPGDKKDAADADKTPQPKRKRQKPGNKEGEKKPAKEDANADAKSSEDQKALQAAFDKRMQESIDAGELELTPEEFEKFGGREGFSKMLRDFQERLTPADIARLMQAFNQQERIAPDKFDPDQPIMVNEAFFREVLDAFHSVIAGASDATHLVFRGSEWKSLCTVVREDGYALTKASEIETRGNQALNVLLEKGRLVSAKAVRTWPKHDLALIKLNLGSDSSQGDTLLSTVAWHRSDEPMALGTLIAAAGSGPDPLAIGVVSVKPRSLSGGNKGFLGIGTDSHPKGVRVTRVLPTGNAGKAGIKVGDVITRINDAVCDTPEKLIREVSGTDPGETVTVFYLRDEKEQSKKIKLGDRGELDGAMAAGERANRMNRFGTDVSRKSSGYLRVLQSDLPIQPQHCGGPVVDLQGRVIGLNIARAGRIKTYALLSEDVAALVEEGLQQVRADQEEAPKPKSKAGKKAPAEKK